MTFVSMMITDKFGRRSLMVYSMTSMGICFLALSYYFFAKKYNPRVADSLDWLPLITIVLYISMYSIGCGPIPYIIIGEIFSSEVSYTRIIVIITL
jgi:SP family facilitated glucose transporter-like MFS transporter 8